jgi:hypothetical protein
MLGPACSVVFSKCAVLWAPVRAQHAGRDARVLRCRRKRRAIGRRGLAVGPGEARRERADALQADREADLHDRAVGRAKQRGCPLQPARQQVRVRRLAECAPELATEVRAREPGGAGEIVDIERLRVRRIDEVAGSQQVTLRWDNAYRQRRTSLAQSFLTRRAHVAIGSVALVSEDRHATSASRRPSPYRRTLKCSSMPRPGYVNTHVAFPESP